LLFSIIRMQSCLIEHRKFAIQDTLQRGQYKQTVKQTVYTML